ncbi:MAG: hypothetical protein ACI9MJ_002704, partial [Alphaproteobacteria bacterium]
RVNIEPKKFHAAGVHPANCLSAIESCSHLTFHH